MASEISTETEVIHRCLRPGCGRKLTSPESITRGYGPRCAAKIRAARRQAELSVWTPAQLEQARELIEDGGVVPTPRPDVFRTVSTDGAEVYVTHPKGCNCPHGLRTLRDKPCYHRAAVLMVLAA